jgi:hypothetical protein
MGHWSEVKFAWGCLGVVIFAILLFFGLWAFGVFGGAAMGIIEDTFDKDNIVYNYEWFKKTYEAVQALDIKIENAQAQHDGFLEGLKDVPRKDWDFTCSNEDSRLRSIVTGLKNQREDVVAEYNAKSKMANRKIFKDNDLPETLK